MTITHKIPETGVELVFVPVPEDASGYNLETATLIFDIKHGIDKVFVPMPNVGFESLGLLKDLKEEDFSGIMPRKSPYSGLILFKYKDYLTNKYCLDSDEQSLQSLMRSLKLYTENPYGSKPKLVNSKHVLYQQKINHFNLWQEAEKTVSPNWWIGYRQING